MGSWRCQKKRMRATEIVYANLYGVEMKYGKVDIPKYMVFDCYMIVEHTSDKEYIEKQAMELILAGCKNFFFYGDQCEKWREIFAEMYSRLFVGESVEVYKEGISIVSCEELDEFIETLYEAISCRTFIPCVNLLIYDDELVYKKICRRIQYRKNYMTSGEKCRDDKRSR